MNFRSAFGEFVFRVRKRELNAWSVILIAGSSEKSVETVFNLEYGKSVKTVEILHELMECGSELRIVTHEATPDDAGEMRWAI